MTKPLPPDPDLFDRATAEAHALFTLAASEAEVVVEGADVALVNMAVTAGILGALAAIENAKP